MKLSAPIYHLKRQARMLSRAEKIPLHEALDRIAANEGYSGWSLLSAKLAKASPAVVLYPKLGNGELVLIAARPGHGKTLLSLELAVEAMKAGHRSFFFSLEYTDPECRDLFERLEIDLSQFENSFEFDGSDTIDAGHVVERLTGAPAGTVAVIDYLQLLDQRRETPELMEQVRALRSFAQRSGVVLVFISQVDRAFDPATKACPDSDDLRLPNPVDLALFDKKCFLHAGEVRFG